MHDDVRCSRDERKKPKTICFYAKTKGGVDVADMVIGKCTTKYIKEKVDNECLCLHARHYPHKCKHSFQ